MAPKKRGRKASAPEKAASKAEAALAPGLATLPPAAWRALLPHISLHRDLPNLRAAAKCLRDAIDQKAITGVAVSSTADHRAMSAFARRRWPILHTLKLQDGIDIFGSNALAEAARAEKLPLLRSLTVFGVGMEDLAGIVGVPWPSLQDLDLGNYRAGALGATELAHAARHGRLPRLRSLDFSEGELTGAGVQELVKATWETLERLSFRDCPLTYVGAAALGRHASSFPALRSLDCSGCGISSQGIHNLLFQEKFLKLEELELGTVTVPGWALAGLKKTVEAAKDKQPSLKSLRIQFPEAQPPPAEEG